MPDQIWLTRNPPTRDMYNRLGWAIPLGKISKTQKVIKTKKCILKKCQFKIMLTKKCADQKDLKNVLLGKKWWLRTSYQKVIKTKDVS